MVRHSRARPEVLISTHGQAPSVGDDCDVMPAHEWRTVHVQPIFTAGLDAALVTPLSGHHVLVALVLGRTRVLAGSSAAVARSTGSATPMATASGAQWLWFDPANPAVGGSTAGQRFRVQ